MLDQPIDPISKHPAYTRRVCIVALAFLVKRSLFLCHVLKSFVYTSSIFTSSMNVSDNCSVDRRIHHHIECLQPGFSSVSIEEADYVLDSCLRFPVVFQILPVLPIHAL